MIFSDGHRHFVLRSGPGRGHTARALEMGVPKPRDLGNRRNRRPANPELSPREALRQHLGLLPMPKDLSS